MLSSFDFRCNSIGFLRLFFASTVVWSHAYYLGGFGDDPIGRFTHGALTAGFLSVGGFFVLSGFLITGSFERVGNLGRYLWHRFLRIYPGFWICLIVVAFACAPLLYLGQYHTLTGFLEQRDSPWGFVFHNALLPLRQMNVSGPFHSLPFGLAINSSLWTLQYEFYCYLAVGVFGAIGTLKRRPDLVVVALIGLLLTSGGLDVSLGMHPAPLSSQVLMLFVFFTAGVSAYLCRDRIPVRRSIAIFSAAILIVTIPTPAYGFFVPPCLAYLTLFAAMKLTITNVDRRADLSYGIYIYAFPLQQLLAMYRVNSLGHFWYFLAAIALVIPLAVASWFWVERPSLSLKEIALPSLAWLRE